MSDWKKKWVAVAESGATPTADQLEEALLGAMNERNALEAVVTEQAAWLGKLSGAYLGGDGAMVHDILRDFAAKHLAIITTPTAGGLH